MARGSIADLRAALRRVQPTRGTHDADTALFHNSPPLVIAQLLRFALEEPNCVRIHLLVADRQDVGVHRLKERDHVAYVQVLAATVHDVEVNLTAYHLLHLLLKECGHVSYPAHIGTGVDVAYF